MNRNVALKATTPEIDLEQYRSVLKDQSAVANAEKVLSAFKPVDYDVNKWNGVVDAFEGKAVGRISSELLYCEKGDWGGRKRTKRVGTECRRALEMRVVEAAEGHEEFGRGLGRRGRRLAGERPGDGG